MIAALTGPLEPKRALRTSEANTTSLIFASDDEVLEAFHARRWTDGLPFVLPTEERVRAMITGSGRKPSEVIGVVPPRWAEATVENLAINAVMAGRQARGHPHRGDRRARQALRLHPDVQDVEVGDAKDRARVTLDRAAPVGGVTR